MDDDEVTQLVEVRDGKLRDMTSVRKRLLAAKAKRASVEAQRIDMLQKYDARIRALDAAIESASDAFVSDWESIDKAKKAADDEAAKAKK